MEREEIVRRIKEVEGPGGEGSGTWPLLYGETYIPSSGEAEELTSYSIPLDVDPEIKGLVLELNRRGYSTYGSCAGHRDRGFISFESGLPEGDRREILSLVRRYGLRNIRHPEDDWFTVSFSPVGRRI